MSGVLASSRPIAERFALLAFHGTSVTLGQGESLIPSESGSLGAGVYFAGKRRESAEYGANVYECRVHLERPWVIALDCDSELGMQMDFDCPAIEAVMALPGGEGLVRRAMRHDKGHFVQDLTDALIAAGYDGIVGTYPDGCQEIVAFRGDQARIQSMCNGAVS